MKLILVAFLLCGAFMTIAAKDVTMLEDIMVPTMLNLDNKPPQAPAFIVDAIRMLVDLIVDQAKKIIDDIQWQSNNMFETFDQEMDNYLTESTQSIADFFGKTQEIVGNMAGNDTESAVAECLENQRIQLEEVRQELIKQLLQCSSDASDRVLAIRQKIDYEINEIRTRVERLITIIRRCAGQSSPISAALCTITQARTITELMNGVVENARSAAKIVRAELIVIAADARTCANSAKTEASASVTNIIRNTVKCISNAESVV